VDAKDSHLVNKYRCPSCAQECSRRFNMEMHIKRKHRGIGLPLNNLYGTFHPAVFNNPHLPRTNSYRSNIMVDNQANFDDSRGEYGFSDSFLNHLGEAVEIKNLMGQLMTPFPQQPSAQQFSFPNSWNQYQGMWPRFYYPFSRNGQSQIFSHTSHPCSQESVNTTYTSTIMRSILKTNLHKLCH
jgi:hypothetical protein